MRKSSLFVLFLALLMSFLFLNSCDNLATTLPMTKDEFPISDSTPEKAGSFPFPKTESFCWLWIPERFPA